MAGPTQVDAGFEVRRRMWGVNPVLRVFLVLLPVLVQGALLVWDWQQQRSVWAWYPDPGYVYLLAGASVISGGEPALVYHPGTSFQWIIGIGLFLTHRIFGHDDFLSDVAFHPEFYIYSVGVLIAAIYLLALLFAAFRMSRYLGFRAALAFQLIMLWGLPLIANSRYQLWPESLVVSMSVVVVALLAPFVADSSFKGSRALLISLAVVAAIGLTSKVVFLPMLVLVVATIPLRRMLTVLLGVAISSLIILATVRNQIPRMFEWFASIGLSSGRHGGSSDTSLVVNAITSVNSLSGFLPGFRLIVLSLFLSLSVFAVLARKSHVELRPLVATAVALVTVVLLTVKQSEPRDLVTIVPIMGLAVSWLVFALTQRIGGRWGIVAGSSIVVLFIGAVGLSVLRYGLFMNTTSQVVSAKVVDAEQLENSMSDGTWALGYNVWTQSNSLLFGANDAVMFGVDQSDPLGDREIGNAYPGALHFDHWNGDIRGIDSSGRLADLSCVEVKQLVDGRGLSLAVESEAHLMVKSSAEGLELAGGVGTLSPIGKVGGYLTYRLMNISCN